MREAALRVFAPSGSLPDAISACASLILASTLEGLIRTSRSNLAISRLRVAVAVGAWGRMVVFAGLGWLEEQPEPTKATGRIRSTARLTNERAVGGIIKGKAGACNR